MNEGKSCNFSRRDEYFQLCNKLWFSPVFSYFLYKCNSVMSSILNVNMDLKNVVSTIFYFIDKIRRQNIHFTLNHHITFSERLFFSDFDPKNLSNFAYTHEILLPLSTLKNTVLLNT